jgi:cytochrome P450
MLYPLLSCTESSNYTKDMAAQAARAMTSPKPTNTQYRTIFHEILNSKLPPEEKTIARLGDEAGVTLAAGTLTTSWTLSIALYYLLTMPSILQNLKTELNKGAYLPGLNVLSGQFDQDFGLPENTDS